MPQAEGNAAQIYLTSPSGILNAEDEHMLSHPAFLTAEVGGDTESEALLAEQNVSAVAGVDGPDGVVLREVADVAVVLIKLRLGVQTLDEVVAVAERIEDIVANTGHDEHVEHDVNGVGKLNAVFCKVESRRYPWNRG